MVSEPARSRRTWPGPMSTAGVQPGHTHDLPDGLLRRIRLLASALVVFGVCLAVFVYLFVSLIQTRSAERNDQNDRTNQRINDSICDLLDQLPEGGLLDRPRHKYGCGPGLPLDRLTPEERAELSYRGTPSPPSPQSLMSPPSVDQPLSSGAVLNPPRATVSPAPPRPTLPPR